MGVVHLQGDSTKNQSFGGYEKKAEGWYDIAIEDIQMWPGNAEKGPAGIMKGTIVSSDAGVHLGEKISQFYSYDFKQSGRWRVLCENAGVPFNTAPNPDGTEGIIFDTDHFKGRHLRIHVKHNGKYENWDEIEVSRFNTPGGQAQPAAQQQNQYVQSPQQGYQPPQHMPGSGNPPPAR